MLTSFFCRTLTILLKYLLNTGIVLRRNVILHFRRPETRTAITHISTLQERVPRFRLHTRARVYTAHKITTNMDFVDIHVFCAHSWYTVYTIQVTECSYPKRQNISAHKTDVNAVYVTTVRKLKNEGHILNKSVCNVIFNLHSEKCLEAIFEVIKNYDLTTFRITE